MHYQIIPLEMGSLVERHVFQQNNKEIKCGRVWKLGSVLTTIRPNFLKAYDPNVGICIEDIPGGVVGKTFDGEKVIYFSDTVEDEERDELTDIFYLSSKKYSKNFEEVFHDLGWFQVSSESYIFGELEVKELGSEPESYK